MEAGTSQPVKLEDLHVPGQLSGRKHILSILVENKPGVLARVAGLFSRRGFNIDTLAVGPTDDPSVSRVTLTLDGAVHPIDQVTKQLHKLDRVDGRSEEHTSELQSHVNLVCRLLLEKKKKQKHTIRRQVTTTSRG